MLAPAALEGVVLGGAVFASLYLGLCIGSFLMATGQTVTTSTFMAFLTAPLGLPSAPWMIQACAGLMECQKQVAR